MWAPKACRHGKLMCAFIFFFLLFCNTNTSKSLILHLYNKTDDSFVENAQTTEEGSKFSVRVNGGRPTLRLCSQATAKEDGQFTQDLVPLAGVPDLAFNRSSRHGNYYVESVAAAMHGSWDRALTRAPTAPQRAQTCHFICASFAHPPGTGIPHTRYIALADMTRLNNPCSAATFKQR